MSDFPHQSPPVPPFLHTFMEDGWGMDARSTALGAAIGTWVANLAVFVPMLVRDPYPVRRVFWVNGSTVTGSNADFGIYTTSGAKIYSTGSTALVGTSAPQFVTPAQDFVLHPGRYYFAYACDGTTSRSFFWAATVAQQRRAGILQQATALPLPATATFAAPANAMVPAGIGVTFTASGF